MTDSALFPSRLRTLLVLLLGMALTLAQPFAAEQQPGAFLGSAETTYPDWFKPSFLDFEEEIATAAAAGRRYLLFIHQDGCPYCNRMVTVNLAQKDIQETMREHLDVVELNMWGDREVVSLDGQALTEKQFAQVLRVQFTPTLIFFDEQGKVVLRLNGYVPPAQFRVALDYVTQRQDRHGSYRDYVAANRPPPSNDRLNHESFFKEAPHDLTRDPAAGRPLAVFFEQPDCPNCDTLHARVLTDPETRKLISGFDAVQLDMWSDSPIVTPTGEHLDATAWAQELGVIYAPTLVLFDAAGNEVIRSEAWFRIFHTQGVFDYVSSGGYREEPSFQRWLTERAERIRETGRDVNIWR